MNLMNLKYLTLITFKRREEKKKYEKSVKS